MKQFFVWVSVLVMSLLLCGCENRAPERVQSVDTAMGTVIQQNLYLSQSSANCTGEILELIRELEEDTLSWRLETSEVYRINQAAGSGQGAELSEELSQVMERCLKLTEDSGGAFDVTLGLVARLWDIDSWAAGLRTGEFQAPDEQTLTQALALCGSHRLHPESVTDAESGLKLVLYPEEGAMLDLGAVGKGMALDRILEKLQEDPGVLGGTVSVGGSVLTYGMRPDGTPWRVGIADPDDPSVNLGLLSLEGQWCVSTSGDYERYVESGGMRYHHILNPATGRPADSGLSSVTIAAKDGLLSDALSTACFVLGREKGLELAEQYNVEALFVERDGEIFMTTGMEELFQALP